MSQFYFLISGRGVFYLRISNHRQPVTQQYQQHRRPSEPLSSSGALAAGGEPSAAATCAAATCTSPPPPSAPSCTAAAAATCTSPPPPSAPHLAAAAPACIAARIVTCTLPSCTARAYSASVRKSTNTSLAGKSPRRRRALGPTPTSSHTCKAQWGADGSRYQAFTLPLHSSPGPGLQLKKRRGK
ncbi:hypothetical protein PLESTB_000665100 [Pleodorina starrii]|uniref:Uncharacterized protein n=1 Tax=Pleodorina starrii TaxID=330485 RepID=A0A9W6BIH4_9CHLO|nr:hypothetical protein PLESTB_000665100 [Pleodorina starrii]GLC65896.1 hypothetical protein PLESTF_000355500 [Pleodorina starrii]